MSKRVPELSDFARGDRVRYVPYHAQGNVRHQDCENGIVTSVSESFVFVRFKGETSEACKPDQLVKA